MGISRWLLGALALAGVGIAGLALAARLSDGPIGPFAGGPFRSGERVPADEPVDWARLADRDEVELQLVEPPRSRTTWIAEYQGAAYIPCGFPNFRLWKQWPREAVADGRSVLRVADRLYDGRLSKVEDAELHARVAEVFATKYDVSSDLGPERLWLFRFER